MFKLAQNVCHISIHIFIPILTGGIKNKVVKKVIQLMIDKIFSSIEQIFWSLKETKGEYARTFSNIDLNNAIGVLKAIYWLTRIAAKPL